MKEEIEPQINADERGYFLPSAFIRVYLRLDRIGKFYAPHVC